MGDPERGKALYKKFCLHCHTVEKDGKHRAGPNLYGIIGKPCGSMEGFAYSEANKKRQIQWTVATLDTFMENPKKLMPGTKMTSPVIRDPQDRKDIIAYLEKLAK